MKHFALTMLILISFLSLSVAQYCPTCPDQIATSYSTTDKTQERKPGTDLSATTVITCAWIICEMTTTRVVPAKKEYLAFPVEGGKFVYAKRTNIFSSEKKAKDAMKKQKSAGNVKQDAYVRTIYGVYTFE